ncbi:MAG: hypothetical protein HDT30_01080 [Clostridiales bacterium]|nr:hypothetical protein [Clostridiales bacterium]
MNNDLISRQLVVELIESKLTDGHLSLGEDKPLIDAGELLTDISDIATTYNANKVVEQVGEEFERIAGELLDKTGSELQLCDFNIKPFTQRLAEIVKAGGVNEG